MKETLRVTGLMSGSSMDGVDLACCDLVLEEGSWSYRILAARTFPYGIELRSKLETACHWSPEEINKLDLELGTFYGQLINRFHRKEKLRPAYISSHGHTILHDPAKGITFQAGNGRIIAEKTGITVINDFRKEDVAQGGQGAPLVPLGDKLLFSGFEGCLNLGGFANISFDDHGGTRTAYDLCPANMALNWVASLKGKTYDRSGVMGRSGVVRRDLLEQMNQLDFYRIRGPKSLGREWFLDQFLPILKQSRYPAEDLMATLQEHLALQISSGINDAGIGSLLVTGGGALNLSLMERIRKHTQAFMEIPEESLLHYKEALIFALLGILRIRGEINCLSSVTGGRKDLSAGTIHRI